MNGEDLYNLYVIKTDEIQNCSMDSWDQLSESEQATWDAMAQELIK